MICLACLPLLLSPLLPPLQDEAGPQDGGSGFPGLPVGHTPRVEVAWNRLYDVEGLYAIFDRLVEAYPDLIEKRILGRSIENRELRVYVIHAPNAGEETDVPAMWVDGNVHGNEVQGGEAVAYLAWYLLENQGHNARVTALLERATFYLVPTINPDGRAHWFADAHTPHSSRTGVLPVDNDHDGTADEDPPNDLDGDGQIVQMRKYVPGEGNFRLNADDPRRMERVPPNDRGITGDWILLGSEGIDDDGDGRINEDGVGGYDMNRAWPSLWEPEHVQYGAGPYPLYWPETRSVATFILDHPNVAAVQSFHNAGGMILRGPGAEAFGSYPAADVAVYDSLGRKGERMLPFYRYMVIWKDLYSVFGGFVTWTYEGLGIISFTNELWPSKRRFPQEDGTGQGDAHFFDDQLLSGAGWVEWHPYDHPLYGKIEIGGFRSDVGRVPPTFLVEEELHRNAMFCLAHAEAMPEVTLSEPEITQLGPETYTVDVVLENKHLIPTRTARAREKHIGIPDIVTLHGQRVKVLAGGVRTDRFRPSAMELTEEQPYRILLEGGVPSRGRVRLRFFVRGSGDFVVRYGSQKARGQSRQGRL